MHWNILFALFIVMVATVSGVSVGTPINSNVANLMRQHQFAWVGDACRAIQGTFGSRQAMAAWHQLTTFKKIKFSLIIDDKPLEGNVFKTCKTSLRLEIKGNHESVEFLPGRLDESSINYPYPYG
ncbi:hypothetical protein PG984_015010 [Apiospora sp. TS-2023a]